MAASKPVPASKRVRVFHKALGEVVGRVVRREGSLLLVQFEGHDKPIWVSAKYVSEAEDGD